MSKTRFIKLGWELLEHKYRYYILNMNTISDYDFDQLEAEYRKLAEELGLPPSASDMVGFDNTRFSCQLAMHRVKGGTLDNLVFYDPNDRTKRKKK